MSGIIQKMSEKFRRFQNVNAVITNAAANAAANALRLPVRCVSCVNA
jgi:hypothetical protein